MSRVLNRIIRVLSRGDNEMIKLLEVAVDDEDDDDIAQHHEILKDS